jgi:hypothetical protein
MVKLGELLVGFLHDDRRRLAVDSQDFPPGRRGIARALARGRGVLRGRPSRRAEPGPGTDDPGFSPACRGDRRRFVAAAKRGRSAPASGPGVRGRLGRTGVGHSVAQEGPSVSGLARSDRRDGSGVRGSDNGASVNLRGTCPGTGTVVRRWRELESETAERSGPATAAAGATSLNRPSGCLAASPATQRGPAARRQAPSSPRRARSGAGSEVRRPTSTNFVAASRPPRPRHRRRRREGRGRLSGDALVRWDDNPERFESHARAKS